VPVAAALPAPVNVPPEATPPAPVHNRPPQVEFAQAPASENVAARAGQMPEPPATAEPEMWDEPLLVSDEPALSSETDLPVPAASRESAPDVDVPPIMSEKPAPVVSMPSWHTPDAALAAPVVSPPEVVQSAPAVSPPAPLVPVAQRPTEPAAGETEEPARAPTATASAQEPAIVIVPTRLRAAADEDEFGHLLPPPSYIKEQARPEEVPTTGRSDRPPAAQRAAAPLVIHIPLPPDSVPPVSAAPALPTPVGLAPAAQRCPAPVTTQVRSFEAGRLALFSGVLEPAFSSPYKGASHRVVQGSTTIAFLLEARPELNLAQYAGRRVEVLGVLSESSAGRGDQLLQVNAVHPLD
jgi:hypothetical protein